MIFPKRLEKIEKIIADAASVEVEDLRNCSRIMKYVQPRQAVWFIAHDYLNMSFHHIGKLYGRHHTTVMSGVERVRANGCRRRILAGIKKIYPTFFLEIKKDYHDSENWIF